MASKLFMRLSPETDDGELVRAAQKGNEKAFSVLLDKYTSRLWPNAFALSNNQFDDAQDLIQETFLRAYHRLHTLQTPQAFYSWLTTLMGRLATTRRGRMQHRAELLTTHPGEVVPGPASIFSRTPEEEYLSQELEHALEQALDHLTATSREIFTAFHVDGHSIREITARTGLSVGAVKSRLFQTRKKLRKELVAMIPETTVPSEIPEGLNIVLMGQREHENHPLHPNRLTQRLLPRRVLYACRKIPRSTRELSKYLHVDPVYIEDLVSDLVRGELLDEPVPGSYQTSFLFVNKTELAEISDNLSFVKDGVSIIKKHVPRLRSTLEETTLVRQQGYDWPHLAWIAIPVWIASRGLGRQVANSLEWGQHHIMTYPLRPVDFWHLLGMADVTFQDIFSVDAASMESEHSGMAFSLSTAHLDERKGFIDFSDLDRYVGRLSRGPVNEEALLEDANFPEKEKLARYVAKGFIKRTEENTFHLDVPTVTAEDDKKLALVVDEICSELAPGILDQALSGFAREVEDVGFEHLLAQPYYLGFVGFHLATTELVRGCLEEHLLSKPNEPDANFGYWTWYRAPNLMKSWSKGRS